MNDLSLCMITLGEPTLERAVTSARPFISELCIVYTGPDEATAERVRSFADRFEWYQGANWPDGGMRDFSKVRARSLALVTQPAAIWLDSDDTLEGGERIAPMLASVPPGKAVYYNLQYVYARDSKERPQAVLWRERIVTPVRAFAWRFAVHECLLGVPGIPVARADYQGELPRVIHHRGVESPGAVARNLRILQAEAEEHPEDARTRFYLAMAHFDARHWEPAVVEFVRYIETQDAVAGPDIASEQRAFACMRVSAAEVERGNPEGALAWAKRAVEEREWAECYFQVARAHVSLAMDGGPEERRHWERAAHNAYVGLALPLTQTALPVNPMERSFHIHQTLHHVLYRLGNLAGAHESAMKALSAVPDDRVMLGNAIVYEAELARRNIELAAAQARGICEKAEEYAAAGDIGTAVLGSIRQLTGAPLRGLQPGKLDVVFLCGVAPETWSPAVAERTGIGGSETSVIELARTLSGRGHKVRVYNNCGGPQLDGDVQYLPFDLQVDGDVDILVAWRHSQLVHQVRAKVKWIWCHDANFVGGLDPWTLHQTKRVLALSRWHESSLAGQGVDVRKIYRTRNGIDHGRFKSSGATRSPKTAIFSSAPSRGLAELLQIWPEVRRAVDGATLEVYYGWDSWESTCRLTGDRAALIRIARLKEAVAGTEGVRMVGRVNGRELAQAMMRAGVWLHPSWDGGPFFETNCIGVQEAQAAGLRVVAAAHGGLPEVVRNGQLVDYDGGNDWLEKFANAAITALVVPEREGERESIAAAVSDLGWGGVAEQWEAWMLEDIAERKVEDGALVTAGEPERLKVHVILSPDGTGRQLLDPRDPSGGSSGGGGKAGFLGLVRGLGRLGKYDVTALSTFRERRAVIDGVTYLGLEEPVERMDVIIAYYDVRVLQGVVGPLRIGMHHTLKPYGDGRAWPFTDVNTAPSEWALEYLRRMRPRSTWRVIPNAVEGLEGVTWRPVPGRVIHHTSPDRGLYHLLERWGEIRGRVPGATLHVIGNPQDIIRDYSHPGLRGSDEYDMAMRLDAGIKTAREVGGVQFTGPLPRDALIEEISEASVFASAFELTIPSETWSMSIHECCAVGVPCVIAPADALESLWCNVVEMTLDIQDDQGQFVDAVVRMLTNPEAARAVSERQREHVRQFSFDRTAQVMSDVIEEAWAKRNVSR